MSKLFALEELDEVVNGAEMETSAEEGEVADVQVDMEEEASDADSQETAIDDGMGAAGQLEEIESVVEASIEEGEGLDPIAAEAVRIAVEAICARVGANPKSMYALYATENFQSASSRKANSRIALEGIGDFLKNLWEKIKAAVSNLWEKVIAFWNKHISNLGRVLKALESAKKKVSDIKGTSTNNTELKAGSSLESTFTGAGNLGYDEVKDYIDNHSACMAELLKNGEGLVTIVEHASNVQDPALLGPLLEKANGENLELGTESKPLVGGTHAKHTYVVENVKTEDESISIKFDVEEGTIDKVDKDRDLDIASKDNMKSLLEATIVVIKADIKARDKIDKYHKSFNDVKKRIDKVVVLMSDTKKTGVAKGDLRKWKQAITAFNTVHSKIPTLTAKLASADVRLAKGVIGFVAVCSKQYKVQ